MARVKKQLLVFLIIVASIGLLGVLGFALKVVLDVHQPLTAPEDALDRACVQPLRDVFAQPRSSAAGRLIPAVDDQTSTTRARIMAVNGHYSALMEMMRVYHETQAQNRDAKLADLILSRMRSAARQYQSVSNEFYVPPFTLDGGHPELIAEASTKMYQIRVYTETALIVELIRSQHWSQAVQECRLASFLPAGWALEEYGLRHMGAAGSRQLYQRAMRRNLDKIGHALFGAGAGFFGEGKE